MGQVVGTVTRQGAGSPKDQYSARIIGLGSGTTLGPFGTLTEAQRAVQRSFGRRLLRWRRDDMSGTVESYRAEDPAFQPNDLDAMSLWLDASQGVRKLDPDQADVVVWGDFSQTGHPMQQFTAMLMPDLELAGPGGRPTIEIGIGMDHLMVSALPVEPPFTMFLVAAAIAPTALVKVAVRVPTLSGPDFIIGTSTAGPGWRIENSGTALVGAAVSAGTLAIVTARQNVASCEFFFDGGTTPVDSNASAPAPGDGTTEISALTAGALETWGGSISALLVYGRSLSSQELSTVHSYLKDRYSIP